MKYQRLEDLRTDHDLTIRQVADYLGCNRDVYTRCLLYTSDAADEL